MKEVFSFILLISTLTSFSQLDVKSYSYDFGTIFESDKEVETSFEIKNATSDTIYILGIESSCGCTSFILEENKISPKQKVNLIVSYNTKGRFGKFHKSIKLSYKTGGEKKEVLFAVRGNTLKSQNEHVTQKITGIKIQPFVSYPVSEYDTSFAFFPKLEGFINGLSYEIDQHGFATLGVDHISYTISNKGRMDGLILRMKNRIKMGLIERGYQSYQINYKQTEFDFNFIPDWAMSEIRLYSVKYNDDSVYNYQVKKEQNAVFKSDNSYVKTTEKVELIKKKEKTILDDFFRYSDMKIMVNDSIEVELEFRFPYKYDQHKGKLFVEKLLKSIDKYYSKKRGFKLLSYQVNYQTETSFSFLAFHILSSEKQTEIVFVRKETNVIPPMLPLAHYPLEFNEKHFIDTSDVDIKRILINAIIHIQKGREVTFNIESSVSHFPKSDKQTSNYHARQNSRLSKDIIKEFMRNRNVSLASMHFSEIPLVQGPTYSWKYKKSFYKRFEYLNIIPVFSEIDSQEIKQTKYKVNFNSNDFTLDITATMFKVFMNGIIQEINAYGYAKIILESSSSKAPTRTLKNLSSDVISYKRAEETRDIMKSYLYKVGIDPNRLILVEERSLVQGPKYDLDYFDNKEKYKQFQYIKIIPNRLLKE